MEESQGGVAPGAISAGATAGAENSAGPARGPASFDLTAHHNRDDGFIPLR